MLSIIRIEPTPNPDALKFVVSESLLESGVRQFDTVEAAESDPIAKDLFALEGVMSVFYMAQFITVAKSPDQKWSNLEGKIKQVIESHEGTAGANGHQAGINVGKMSPEDIEMLEKINNVIDQNIRPALAGDGGGLEVVRLDNKVLTIHYQGACGSCPSATAGTMGAIQNLLQRMVDPAIRVVNA